jgi:hypothetical protein
MTAFKQSQVGTAEQFHPESSSILTCMKLTSAEFKKKYITMHDNMNVK